MLDQIKDVLKVFDENDLWDEGIELIGSWCFLFYQKHFGAKSYPLRTQDVDFLIPLPYKGQKKFDVGNALEKLGFQYRFNPDGSIYYWTTDLKVEFLVPEHGKGVDHALSVKPLSLKATPLRFVSMLLKDPVTIRDGDITVKIPNPLNFCLHKLIIAQRRKKTDKKQKDIEQAIYTLPAIKIDEFIKEFNALPKKWKGMIRKSLTQATQLLPWEHEIVERFFKTLK